MVDGTTGVFSIHGTVFDLGFAYTESVRTSVSASGRGCTEKSSLKSCKRIRASKPDGVSLSNKMLEPGGTAFPFQLSLMPYNGAPSSLKKHLPRKDLSTSILLPGIGSLKMHRRDQPSLWPVMTVMSHATTAQIPGKIVRIKEKMIPAL